ncbi:M20/M25/M40 family metallo-hydrolase [Kribbella speibonae]|uniref:M20/M25/M40 family metallo-hydrolase n=1 Tax=Kribbella speibonae TaxID=1572660 RepID=A0A4R0IET2_9ACTN|nr:M20/M25/M40 family metallo-hydrolase [Kribbella speibonae]TCC31009.1 M20/M25/M40 family metallo-hydrolase [Kribbella speibonae]
MILPKVLAAAEQRQARRLTDLLDWLAIPSVSADPRRTADVRRAARWLASWQRARGAMVDLRPTPQGRDVVVARWPAAPGARQVVIYGHYDVQPAGPGWSSHPFRPVIRDGVIYARGANDDKGQLFAHLCALDAWPGLLPAEVIVIAEGAEEVGSTGFAGVIDEIARQLRPMAVIVSDTERYDDGTPTVTISQRGRLAATLTVDTGGTAVHAGRLGGAVVDPSLVLADALRTLRDQLFVTSVPISSTAVVRTDTAVRRSARGRATLGADLDERITLHGSIGVTRLVAGTGGASLPSQASAVLDLRLPPHSDPADVVRRARGLLLRCGPRGARVQLHFTRGTPALDLTPDRLVRQAVDAACVAVHGRPPVYVRSGGTIPAVGVLARALRIRPLLLGFGPPGGNAHGPDETLDIAGWAAAVRMSATLLWTLTRPIRGDPVPVSRRRDHHGEIRRFPCGERPVQLEGEER